MIPFDVSTFGILRVVGDSHDPAPASLTSYAIHKSNSVCEEAADGATNGGADEEVSYAQSNFSSCVEEGEVNC